MTRGRGAQRGVAAMSEDTTVTVERRGMCC
jgi:hypothetical protein